MTEPPNALPILREKGALALCSICPEPGKCCRRFPLSSDEEITFWKASWREDAKKWLAETGLPFEPLEIRGSYDPKKKPYVTLWYGCTKVTEEGRCSIYAERPDLCRRFLPRNDEICAFALLLPHDGEGERKITLQLEVSTGE